MPVEANPIVADNASAIPNSREALTETVGVDWDKVGKESKIEDLSSQFNKIGARESSASYASEEKGVEKLPANSEQREEPLKDDKQSEDTKIGEEKETPAEGEVQQDEDKGADTDASQTGKTNNEQQQANQDTGVKQATITTTDPIFSRFPEAVAFSKNMAKPARENYMAQLRRVVELETIDKQKTDTIKQLAQGRTPIPDSYYENQHAYILLPEFQQANRDAELASAVHDHWLRQRISLQNGKEYRGLEIVQDPVSKQVTLKPSAPQPYSEDAMYQVENMYAGAVRQMNHFDGQRQSIMTGFHSQVNDRLSKIRSAETELFPPERWGKDDTHEGKMVASVKQGIRELGISEANPAFNLLALAGAALMIERQYRESLTKKADVKKGIAEDTRKAGPTGSSTSGGGGKKTGEDENLDAMFRGFTQPNRRG